MLNTTDRFINLAILLNELFISSFTFELNLFHLISLTHYKVKMVQVNPSVNNRVSIATSIDHCGLNSVSL